MIPLTVIPLSGLHSVFIESFLCYERFRHVAVTVEEVSTMDLNKQLLMKLENILNESTMKIYFHEKEKVV
jgi:hypothetical protein